MTTTYLNKVNTEVYKAEAFQYVSLNMRFISEAASIIGISAGAIAGAMAEENNNYDDYRDTQLRNCILTSNLAG
jgi:hypothetical protein